MDAIRQDDVFSGITQLWPRCRMTKPEFAAGVWLHLRGYGVEVIKSALKHHRATYLDAIRPEWKTLFRELADTGDGSGRNDLEILLTNIRRYAPTLGVKGIDDLKDGEVFQRHLDANPGRMAGIVRGWQEYFADRDEAAPSYLAE